MDTTPSTAAVLPAFAAGLRGLFTILGEITRIVRRSTATLAVLAARAAGLGRAVTILGEVAGISAVLLCHVLLFSVLMRPPAGTGPAARSVPQPSTRCRVRGRV